MKKVISRFSELLGVNEDSLFNVSKKEMNSTFNYVPPPPPPQNRADWDNLTSEEKEYMVFGNTNPYFAPTFYINPSEPMIDTVVTWVVVKQGWGWYKVNSKETFEISPSGIENVEHNGSYLEVMGNLPSFFLGWVEETVSKIPISPHHANAEVVQVGGHVTCFGFAGNHLVSFMAFSVGYPD